MEKMNLFYLGADTLLLLALPLAVLAVWKRKTRGSLIPVGVGALGFILFSKLLEGGVHLFCIVQKNPMSQAILGSPWLYVLYGCAMAGIFEECGRYILFRTLLRNRTGRNTAVGYGIGHGGIEVYLNMVLVMAASFAAAWMAGRGAVLSDNQAALAQAARQFTLSYSLLCLAERCMAMSLHLSLSVIAFRAARRQSPALLGLAVLLHGIADIFAALCQYGLLSLSVTEGLFLLASLGVGGVALRFWHLLGREEAPAAAGM